MFWTLKRVGLYVSLFLNKNNPSYIFPLSQIILGSSLSDNYYLSLCPALEFLQETQEQENRKNLIISRKDLTIYPEFWNWNHLSMLISDIEVFKVALENDIPFQPDNKARFPHEYLISDLHSSKEKKLCLQWLLQKIADGSFRTIDVAAGFPSLTDTFFKYHQVLSDQDLLNYLSLLSVDASKIKKEHFIKQGRIKLHSGLDFVRIDPNSSSYARFQRNLVNESYRRSSYLIDTSVIGMQLTFRIENQETINFLQILADRQMIQLFEQKVVRVTLEYFWRVCLKYQIFLAVLFVIYTAIFSTYSVLRIRGISPEAETGMLMVSIFFSLGFIFIELLEFSGHMKAHLSNLWNYVDIISAILPLVTCCVILSKDSAERYGTGISSAIAWSLFVIYLKLISFFRLSTQTSIIAISSLKLLY